jgi:hypothetical protein
MQMGSETCKSATVRPLKQGLNPVRVLCKVATTTGRRRSAPPHHIASRRRYMATGAAAAAAADPDMAYKLLLSCPAGLPRSRVTSLSLPPFLPCLIPCHLRPRIEQLVADCGNSICRTDSLLPRNEGLGEVWSVVWPDPPSRCIPGRIYRRGDTTMSSHVFALYERSPWPLLMLGCFTIAGMEPKTPAEPIAVQRHQVSGMYVCISVLMRGCTVG